MEARGHIESQPPNFALCRKCLGSGEVFSRKSKNHVQIPCSKCSASGLVRNTPSPTAVAGTSATSDSHESGPTAETTATTTGAAAAAGAVSSPPEEDDAILPVAIVGGGIGGCALAAALQLRGIRYKVFERDDCFEDRHQGYGLTMQQGARALRSIGLEHASVSDQGIHSQRHTVLDQHGEELGCWGIAVWGRGDKKSPPTSQNVHIARQELRRTLLSLLPPETVVWGSKFQQYVEHEDHVEFQLEGASSPIRCQVLVGADGFRSQVRSCKLNDGPQIQYLGCLVILGIAKRPEHDLTQGDTVFQTGDGNARIYTMPFSPRAPVGRDEVMWQLSIPMDELRAKEISSEEALLAEAKRLCSDWHAPIPTIFQNTSVISGYPAYDREPLAAELCRGGRAENRDSRVTLMGDACHPMSPFKGQGANQALLDGVDLARRLYQSEMSPRAKSQKEGSGGAFSPIPKALALFEEKMLARSKVKVIASHEAAQFLHSDVQLTAGSCTRAEAHRRSQPASPVPPVPTVGSPAV